MNEEIRPSPLPEGETPVIEMHGIVKTFYQNTPNELEILHGIDLTIREGEFISIVGASGSGKSTLMNIIGALDHQTAGEYILDGVPMTEMSSNKLSQIRNEKIGFVFQTFNLIPRSTALGNVELPMMYAGVSKGDRSRRAMELLELVGMKDRARHRPNELSGGQKHCPGHGQRPFHYSGRRAHRRAGFQHRAHGDGHFPPPAPGTGENHRAHHPQQ